MKDYEKIISAFKNKKILVIGDIMLDQYLYGEITRLSQEAPMPLVDITCSKYSLGGAGNVANNLAALGAYVILVSACGKDGHITDLQTLTSISGIREFASIEKEGRKTTVKTRIIVDSQQIFRYDIEDTTPIDSDFIDKDIIDLMPKVDAVLISDYAKGIMTNKRIRDVLVLCKRYKKPIIVDSKINNLKKYVGCTVITPNLIELSGAFGQPLLKQTKDIVKYGKLLSKTIKANVLITRGKDGMSLCQRDGKVTHIQTKIQDIIDPCGAGDSVAATMTLALAAGASLEDAATLATQAACVVIKKLGTATCSTEELLAELKR